MLALTYVILTLELYHNTHTIDFVDRTYPYLTALPRDAKMLITVIVIEDIRDLLVAQLSNQYL